jgi:NADH dehydrogenase FAD-containing subunit
MSKRLVILGSGWAGDVLLRFLDLKAWRACHRFATTAC